MPPLNLAHRGARTIAPENTLPAVTRAIAAGADGVEIDVQRTRDGELVVIHDETLETTTDGTGVVREHTLDELERLDAGAWFDAEWAGTRIPTLDEIFDALPESAVVNIELKRASWRSDGLEEATLQFLRRRDVWNRVIVSSFNPLALWRLRTAAPQLRLGLLYQPTMPFLLNRAWPRWFLPLAALHPFHAQVTSTFVERMRAGGLDVNTWTVNEPARMCELIDIGVNAIITDVPDILADVLKRYYRSASTM